MADTYLEIGWQLNSNLHPKYWKTKNAEAGSHQVTDLFRIQAEKTMHHALVFAQSGSGKSFIIGRLIEELCLKTRARCIAFDPNSDYKHIGDVDASCWLNPSYDDETGMGALPTESGKEEFEEEWGKITKSLFSAIDDPFEEYCAVRLNLEDLTPKLFVQQGSENLLLELQFCLRSSVELIALLRELKPSEAEKTDAKGVVELIEKHLTLAKKLSEDELENFMALEYVDVTNDLNSKIQDVRDKIHGEKGADIPKLNQQRTSLSLKLQRTRRRIENVAKSLKKSVELVSSDTVRLYTGKLNDLLEKQLLYGADYEVAPFSQLNVVDLPSYDEEARYLVVGATLSQVWMSARKEWERAVSNNDESDQRVPTFVFVDEAHNLIPHEPVTADQLAIREQFRRIAAEGRKFGIFLILITQRPDKLDPLVVSECENKLILRLGSRDVLDRQKDVLGLSNSDLESISNDVTRFKPGRAVCIGPWASIEPGVSDIDKFYGAARRTRQGGRNLDNHFWTSKNINEEDTSEE